MCHVLGCSQVLIQSVVSAVPGASNNCAARGGSSVRSEHTPAADTQSCSNWRGLASKGESTGVPSHYCLSQDSCWSPFSPRSFHTCRRAALPSPVCSGGQPTTLPSTRSAWAAEQSSCVCLNKAPSNPCSAVWSAGAGCISLHADVPRL